MKKRLLLLNLLLIMATFTAFSQDTISFWDFPNDTATNFTPSAGLSGNMGYDLLAEDTSGYMNARPLSYSTGATSFAATASDWDGGDSIKWWSIKFKASGYYDFKVYSKQKSDNILAGPRDWKLQCAKSGKPYTDIVGGSVTVANNWTTGIVNGLDLPDSMDYPSGSCYIRWIMTSNIDILGGTVGSTGLSSIDDILVTGVSSAGVTNILYENGLSIYPNPANDVLYIESTKDITEIKIYDMTGAMVISQNERSKQTDINIRNLQPGLYFVKTYFANQTKNAGRKIIVQ